MLIASVGACTPPAPGEGNQSPAAEKRQVSKFQRQLDRLGVPFEAPARGKAILVNAPAFELIAFRDGAPEFRSRIIVGAPATPTPMLQTYTASVRFRPTWRPTPAMVASGEYADRVWPAGRRNPLGLAAIRFQDDQLVYLHDTNHRELFQREDRALSHGCVRVERWDELVAWVLDLDLDQVHRLANGRRTFDMPAPPIPVTLGYFTVFPDEFGRRVEYADIYRRKADAVGATPLAQELALMSPERPGCRAPPLSG
jgi:murein L,D-transpeptidase YcbB/YkuD